MPDKKYASADANWACPILLFLASAIDNNFQAAIFLGMAFKIFFKLLMASLFSFSFPYYTWDLAKDSNITGFLGNRLEDIWSCSIDSNICPFSNNICPKTSGKKGSLLSKLIK